MTSAREGSGAGAMLARARDLHRKLLERVLVRSDSQNVKDVFRRYDRERAGVLTVDQFRALVRDHDFLDAEAELLLRHLGAKDQQSVSFHAFMGDVQLGAEQNYPSKNSNSPKKVQQLSQLTEKKNVQPQTKGKAKTGAKKPAVEQVQDPMEAIRTKLRERVMGHSKSIREVFMEYDTDGSGFLDYEEFGRFMAKYKFAPDETQIIVDYLDRDASGTIDYDEFAAGLLFYRPPIPQILDSIRSKFDESMKRSKQRTGRARDLKAEFDNYDVDGSNSLDHQEFGALLVGLGIKLKAAELRTVLEEVDPKEEQRIDLQTIVNLLGIQGPALKGNKGLSEGQRRQNPVSKGNNAALAAFNKYDRDGSGELEYEEFRRLMHESGVKDDKEIDALIDEIDEDGSGSISFDEFAGYDRDGSGELDYEEFRRLMSELGVRDKSAIDAIIDEIDEDGSGSISFAEFARVYDRRIKPSSKMDGEVKAAFSKYDRDGSGELDYEEFRRMMHESGVKDSEVIDALIDEIDRDRSGTISFNEKASQAENEQSIKTRLAALQEQELQFMERVLRHHNSIENAFLEFDREGRNEMDFEQFRDFMGQYGITDEASISMLLKRLDADNSGMIDLQEFLSVFNEQRLARYKGGGKTVARTDQPARLRELEEKWIRGALAAHDSLRSAFSAFDRDQNGDLSRDEFRKLMNQFGIREEEDITSLMKKLDADGNGCIEYEEFATIFHETRNARARLRDLQIKWMKRVLSCHDSIETAFYQYDEDGNGELDHEEFRHFMKRYGIVKNDDIDALIRRLDTDGSGTISLDEFSIERELAQRMAHQTRDLRLAFRKFDTNGNGLLEYKEFRSVLKSYRLPEMEIRKVIRHLDRDVSGFIDYKEFIAGFGAFKESGAAAGSPTQKKAGKRASPGKGHSKPKTHYRRSPAKPQAQSKTPSLEALKTTMLERILAIHGTVQGAFREYDLDKEGCLNEAQFVKLVLDCRFSRDEAARLLDVFDQDQSGTVEYQEFLAQLVVKGNS
ncbi:hypothetical protein PHYSODRAFT_494835 [Phytophthora sojae]|uniref:EF-hand domain-containing protein n=1 Tax=Phytophthora sojae (strain P6497) TaxID=1094619 RepID=G4Z3C0_PHYSP|nr:hypothetical protein PHYSODRAFT_494835 [Phytophthora sojae]EGZ21483.1 hypothetical protein PHYSODRAFT_494835 [Phytophthora sojae]|eukprot:XP_009524200.1 hypothetical protein PHYSODRAFT_494835 [Phytophthora sojae]